ncbi:MAG: hypothetical protein EHM84_08165, partial [Lysobacterales bacterium]
MLRPILVLTCALELLLGAPRPAHAQEQAAPGPEVERDAALLVESAKTGNLMQVAAILSRGVPVDTPDRDGWTP